MRLPARISVEDGTSRRDLHQEQVVGFEVAGHLVRTARLTSGRSARADVFVNTAGCDVPALADQLGMRMPVEPMRRLEHYALTTADMAGLPFIKDADHLAVRPECNAIQAGVVDWNSPAGAALSRLGANSHFINTVWPALAHRFPDFDRIRLISSWSGLYHTNRLDGNMIIGNWPGNLDNFYVACGFPATA